MLHAIQNCMTEWPLHSGKAYADPFNEVTLDVVITDPAGREQSIPAFWAGEQTWRVRYAPHAPGEYRFRSVCSDTSNPDLHHREGRIVATPYEGTNPLLRRGALKVSDDRRYLSHADGTPFFWLADTWWMGFTTRLHWPGEFKMLAADRVAKGFSVIQIVAGIYPDMPPFDPRGFNEAGHPWEAEYGRINPSYFDHVDLRLDWLVSVGLMPCLVGAWGWHVHFTGVDVMKRHWRNLIARYGAYPIVWCVAGEALNAYYKQYNTPEDKQHRRDAWTEITRYVRETDPYHRPITVHPGGYDLGRECVTDASLLDVNMLQTGHEDRRSMPETLNEFARSHALTNPRLPVINGEVCYEGIAEACREEMQRFYFWACMLMGAAGHTYGANGLWQFSRREQPYGPSPHGTSWGDTPWDAAYQLPGAAMVALGKKFLERFEWWRFEPHPDWIEPHATREEPERSYCAGIPGEVRVIYICNPWSVPVVTKLESDVTYRAMLWDPRNGQERELGEVKGDDKGEWRFPGPIPVYHDWVLVLERS